MVVAVRRDGTIRPLKALVTGFRRVRSSRRGRKNGHRGSSFCIPYRVWTFGGFAEDFAKEHGLTAESGIRSMFSLVMNLFAYNAANKTIQIRAKDRGVSARFCIDPVDTPSFFSDREKVQVDGRTKRIFHVVKPHTRSNGKNVKMHFRGERSFVWNGYEIKISIPKRDHVAVYEMDVRAYDEGSVEVGADVCDAAEIGRLGALSEHQRSFGRIKLAA